MASKKNPFMEALREDVKKRRSNNGRKMPEREVDRLGKNIPKKPGSKMSQREIERLEKMLPKGKR